MARRQHTDWRQVYIKEGVVIDPMPEKADGSWYRVSDGLLARAEVGELELAFLVGDRLCERARRNT